MTVNHNAAPAPGIDPQLRVSQEHAAKLHDLQIGAAYEMSADAPLCPPAEIGLPDTYLGSKVSVVGEFGVPYVPQTTEAPGIYQHVAVVGLTSSDKKHTSYVVMGLAPDAESGKMRIVPGGSAHLHPGEGGQKQIVLGRTTEENAIPAERLWGEGTSYASAVSRVHIRFSTAPDGKLRAETLGRYGTKGDIGRATETVRDQGAATPDQSQEAVTPNPELRFQPVEKDPVFQRISQPYEAALQAVTDKYAAESARLKAEYEYDQQGGRSREWEIRGQRQKLTDQIAAEQAPIRKQYEEAVKPYLNTRLSQFNGDMLPGYAHSNQTILDRSGAKSADGKSISKLDPYTRKYTDGGLFPRYGQLIIDARGSRAWGASRTAEKKDDRTGERMTSAQRVVNLAAAMVAGTFRGSDDPIQYRLATDTDLAQRGIDLSPDFRAKVPIYKVTLGIHRTIAERLVAGNDAVFHADQLDR